MALLPTIIETHFERLGLKTAGRSRRATYGGHLFSLSGLNGCVNCRISTALVRCRCSPAVVPMHTFKRCCGIAIAVSSYGSEAATRQLSPGRQTLHHEARTNLKAPRDGHFVAVHSAVLFLLPMNCELKFTLHLRCWSRSTIGGGG